MILSFEHSETFILGRGEGSKFKLGMERQKSGVQSKQKCWIVIAHAWAAPETISNQAVAGG